MRIGIYSAVLILFFVGWLLLFRRIRWLETVSRMMRLTREGMDEAARRRLLENRRKLLTLQKDHSIWYKLEQELNYSGLRQKIPFLTAELWVSGNVLLAALLTGLLAACVGWLGIPVGMIGFLGTEYLFLAACKARAMHSVNNNLLKFLDFLGNYSITAGELTGIFAQVSKYVDEPMRTVLEQCSFEAQTTGDASLALMSMGEKIEHPKFKELVRNMEISVRYCADFTLLVNNSRKNIREYLRAGEERRGLIREAMINMALLLVMAVVALIVVDGLIAGSVWLLLVMTWPGRTAIGIVLFILILFAGKVFRLNQ